MADRVELSQSELDEILAQRKPRGTTEREIIEDKVHEKFQGLMTQSRIDAMMGNTDVIEDEASVDDNYTGAISQEELDRLFKK